MSNKSKGSKAERELYQIFVDNTFRAVRVAGSGMMDNTACDLIAGKVGKKFAIECKSCKAKKKYITKTQINDFLIFSEIFGLEPVVAVRFNREGWFFLHPKDLEDTGENLAISLEEIRLKGKRFGQYFEEESAEISEANKMIGKPLKENEI